MVDDRSFVFVPAEGRAILLGDIREALACIGLHVTQADSAQLEAELVAVRETLDTCRKERGEALDKLAKLDEAASAVLKAMADLPTWALENNDSDDYYCPQEMRPPIQAELARRKLSACYCSDRMSGGLPCPPGKCPNVPAAPVDSKCQRRWCTASNLCQDCQPAAPEARTKGKDQ